MSEASTGASPERPWREELSERVQNFRERRARLLQDVDLISQAEFDFESIPGESRPAEGGKVIEFPREGQIDAELGNPPKLGDGVPPLESVPLERAGGGMRILTSAAVQAGELPLGERAPEPEPMEILLESSPRLEHVALSQAATLSWTPASLGRRFLAGIVDAFVLFTALGLFALIFWLAGGRMSLRPLNLAVITIIIAFFVLFYFGMFIALAAATPGLLSVGLEVRDLDGNSPGPAESFWRGFGYLVSIAALMLGFIWAVVDSEGLTWHDRMSNTFITGRGSGLGMRGPGGSSKP